MSSTSTAPSPTRSERRSRSPEPTGWVGFIVFASVIMGMIGFFQAIVGLTAIFDDEYFLVTDSGLLVSLDYSAWGWIHLILGAVTLAAAVGILSGKMWARAWAITMAMIGAVVNLAFLAAYPVWSVVLITLDVLVIWALAMHGRETRS